MADTAVGASGAAIFALREVRREPPEKVGRRRPLSVKALGALAEGCSGWAGHAGPEAAGQGTRGESPCDLCG